MVRNELGWNTTPSWVSFGTEAITVGVPARMQPNWVFDAKRMIGSLFTDENIHEHKKYWPFKIKEGEQQRIEIMLENASVGPEISPEGVSAEVLKELKLQAEKISGLPVKKGVITVPAYFNQAQKKATEQACQIAGIELERLISEPNAAAYSGGLMRESELDGKNVMVFDFGGGTFDVTIVVPEAGMIDVMGTSGDMALGGRDIDLKLMEFILEHFRTETGQDLQDDKETQKILTLECERAKKALTDAEEFMIEV